MSESKGVIAVESSDSTVEFERYAFTAASPDRPARLWWVTIAYRMPADARVFEKVESELRQRLGPPTSSARDPEDGGFERRVWEDGAASVTLAARLTSAQSVESERMLVNWVDRRLQLVARTQARTQKHDE
jgi:hypothetical protein